jgi:ABC-type bacteriocin/lantibiotic exporter with double-glycine peptidase domain
MTPPPVRGAGRPTGHRGADVSVAEAAAALRSAAADRPLLRRVVALFGPYRRPAALIGVLILITSGLGVASPLLVREIFDRALFVPGGVKVGLLLWLCGLMVVVPALASLLGVWQSYLTTTIGQKVMRDLRAGCSRTCSRCRCGSSPPPGPARSRAASRTTSAVCRRSSPTPRPPCCRTP